MEIGVVGLGRMGGGLALQSLNKNIKVSAFTLGEVGDEFKNTDIQIFTRLNDLVASLQRPRKIFLYVPAGKAVEHLIQDLAKLMDKNDIIIDGGNSYWGDSIRRHKELSKNGIRLLDVGTSGGVSGANEGACFMVGGDKEAFEEIAPILEKISAPNGFAYIGPSGTGHLIKLIHNGIEFGMLQAIGEGMALIEKFKTTLPIDMDAVFKTYCNGSVIRSWLMDLMAEQYQQNAGMLKIPDYIEDTGEVNWLIQDALELEVPVPVISHSVMELFRSRDKNGFDHRAISLMRHGFGGHPFGQKKELENERHTSRINSSFGGIQ
ncbi:phosphogluconate dehydrogenase (NAD(+)-dependent, decarboxylating) [Peredibacter sp. HCB2-198]|uniref:phosphogluconate dehydrogenase (NAD(+)-dependent, decarboxylating) n=1 Tax=Peredibacter sp. HCB2-198 TaxID=3383025 RepID=UPI0038B6207A